MQRFALLILVSVALVVGACARNAPPEQVDEGPRIVVLSPAIADLLADLGLSDRIVARHAFDRFSDESLPIAGDQSGIDYERLLRVRPTHVLLEWGAREPPERLRDFADERQWVVEDFPLLTLDDIRSATQRLSVLFDVEEDAAALTARMNDAWAVRDGLADIAGATLPLYWTNPVGVAGPGSFHHQLLQSMGVRLAVTEGAPYITLDPEDLRRLDPDTLVLFMPGATDDELQQALAPLETLQLRAILEGRVVLVSDPKCLTPSAAMINVADQTADGIARLALD